MKQRVLILFFILYSILVTSESYSQDRWVNIDYSTSNTGENGLISQWVICIFQDHLGRIWFGTADGISVWDGSSWKSYTQLDGLKVNEVGSIIEDDENNIWIGYGDYICGISKFNGDTLVHYDSSDGLINDKVNSIYKDTQGNLWFATDGGISKYNHSTWTNFTASEGLPTERITKIAQDKDGTFLIGTIDKGLLKFDGSQFVSFSWESNPHSFINDVYADSKGDIWAGGYGLYRYNGSWETVNPFPENVYGYIFDIEEDANGNMYFATNEGLSALKGDSWSFYTTSDGAPGNDVRTLNTTVIDKIIIGTTDGVGIFDGAEWSLFQTSNGGLISNEVNYVFKDKEKNIWICTHGGISRYKDFAWESYSQTPSGEKIEWVECGLEDSNGNLWFGTVNGIFMYNSEGWHVYYKDLGWVMNIVEDKNGTLWFTSNTRVYKYDGTSWVIITEADGLLSNNTNGLFKDLHDNIWIGTLVGVSKWDGSQFINYPIDESLTGGAVSSFTENNKGDIIATSYYGLIVLADNTWSSLPNSPNCWFFDSYIDMNNTLWFGSINGLYKFDGDNWTNYTTNDGLISNVISSVFREKNNGVFWFGTNNGISSLIPDIVAHVSESPKKTSKADTNYSLQIQCEGITQPFQFSLNGVSFEKNGGVFENLQAGYYTAYITNAYDTLKIENIKLGDPTGIDPLEHLSDINIFPNPSNGVFHFKDMNGRVEIFNIQGQKLFESNVSIDNNTIDLSGYSNGFYIIRCNNRRGYLIKQ